MILALAACSPSYARTPNKYKGIDRNSQKAQEREAKQMRRYAARQQKAERKMNRAAYKKNMYKPKRK